MSERERKICFFERFVSLKAELQRGGRTRDLPTFQADRFIFTASAPPPPLPKLIQLGVLQFQRQINKNVCEKNGNKRDHFPCCSQVLSEDMGVLILPMRTCVMLDFQIH